MQNWFVNRPVLRGFLNWLFYCFFKLYSLFFISWTNGSFVKIRNIVTAARKSKVGLYAVLCRLSVKYDWYLENASASTLYYSTTPWLATPVRKLLPSIGHASVGSWSRHCTLEVVDCLRTGHRCVISSIERRSTDLSVLVFRLWTVTDSELAADLSSSEVACNSREDLNPCLKPCLSPGPFVTREICAKPIKVWATFGGIIPILQPL